MVSLILTPLRCRRGLLIDYFLGGCVEDIKSQLLDMGICEVLIPLTASPSVEVQGNSAAAIGNLSSKSESLTQFLLSSERVRETVC